MPLIAVRMQPNRSVRPHANGGRNDAELKKIFASVPYIVDIDDSIGQLRPHLRIAIDQDRLEFIGVEQRDVYATIAALCVAPQSGIRTAAKAGNSNSSASRT
jgi:multidrug efflux pump subunit AcrB